LVTLCFCRGMCWRRSWFSLKGKGASRVQRKGKRPYADLAASAISQVHATRCPTTLFVVTITAIRCLRVFDTVAALTKGGPNKSSQVLLYLMYQEGFTYFCIGYSAAITTVFLALVLLLVLLRTRVLERRVHYG